jgi:hypothetical protein
VEAPKPQGLVSLQSGKPHPIRVPDIVRLYLMNAINLPGKFLSIPTQMTISVGSAPPSVLLQFPIPSKGGVPPIIQLMVSYDPTATRGTHVQFGSLDPKVSVSDTLDVYKDQVDEVVRRAGPLAAVGWLHAQLRTV